jgi:DNA repair protein RadA/Sms
MDGRMKEAAKLGFRRALGPADVDKPALAYTGANRLADAIQRIHDSAWEDRK